MTATCAVCRRKIVGALPGHVGVHRTCWSAAGGRIRRVPLAAIERKHQAEISAWLAAFDAETARIEAEGGAR